MRKLARRHPLTLFFVLAAALSWWPWPFYAAGLSSVPIAGFGPFLAAATVLGLTRGRAGIGSLLGSMVRWRVPLRAYLLALGTPLLLSGAAVALNLWLGASRPSAALLGAWVEIPMTMMVILLVPGLGGAWEEPGFRGFALGRLERRWGRMTAPLVLGVLWVIWHLPLFVAGQILPTDVLTVIAASIVIAAVFHVGGESVLIAMLLHATNNAVGGGFASQLFAGADLERLGWLTAAAWCAAAGVVLAVQAGNTLRRRREETRSGRPDAAEVAEHIGIAVGQASSQEPTGSVTSVRSSSTATAERHW
ncbi:CPBP family intramembrane glutamic endopeptidase [Humibacillus sp. DSM 29435]|uniref:CPBP family intramembrane glutamic endopeptidase n=1 Tax=Humibacillus sp. DSM 29435 TaxID=1869167 RepID=UPI0015869DB7|nr:type II CAAX endopeptidase family protein [Humibacillus sp. DSM 29435]